LGILNLETIDMRVKKSLKFKFHPIEEKEICEVVIKPSPRPIFIYDEGGKQQECYVRVGNSSKPYTLDEFYALGQLF
jgi:hypothetical protein